MEHIAGGQARDRANVIGGQRGSVQQPALELEQVERAGRVVERLGGGRGVAVDECERRRPDEHRLELLDPGFVGGPLAERVLDDPEAGVGVAELGAQVGDLRHRDAAVVDREDRLGRADLLGDLVDDG